METISILIADSSEEFRSTLTNALQGNYRLFSCRSGKEALDFALETPPDILILDLMLPELDGISLLQLLFASGIRPLVLATTKLYNDYVVDATAKLGVEYLMIKPCDIRAVVGRVKDLSNSLSKPSLSAPDRRTHVSNLLVSLGVSTKLRGYSYLREAVLYMADNPMASVTKELYPAWPAASAAAAARWSGPSAMPFRAPGASTPAAPGSRSSNRMPRASCPGPAIPASSPVWRTGYAWISWRSSCRSSLGVVHLCTSSKRFCKEIRKSIDIPPSCVV